MTLSDDKRLASDLEMIHFELNEGQVKNDIKYLLDYHNQRLYFKNNGIDLYLTLYDRDLLNIKFTNSQSNVKISHEEQLRSTSVYPALNLKHVKQYKRIKYNTIYHNIDLLFEENNKKIQQTFVINPKGNPKNIQIDLSASELVQIDPEGHLRIKFREKVFFLTKPTAVQHIKGTQLEVDTHFRVDKKTVSLSVGNYDRTQPLIISSNYDFSLIPNVVEMKALQIDRDKNQYIIIQKSQVKDIETVKKLIENLQWVRVTVYIFRIYSGMTADEALAMIASWVQLAYQVKSVVLKKIDAKGQVVQIIKQLELAFEPREILQTVETDLVDEPRDTMEPNVTDLAIDNNGNLYICATTVAKKVNEQTLKPSWYPIHAVQYNPTGNGDGAILKLDSNGFVKNMTYFGGDKSTDLTSIAVYNEEIWITGSTSASDLEVTNGSSLNLVWPDIYIAHFNQAFSDVLFSTYIGGQMMDYGKKILIHHLQDSYEVYVIGNVENDVYIPIQYKPEGKLGYFPTTQNAMQKQLVPGTYGVSAIIKLNAAGDIMESTLFDGGLGDTCISTAAIDRSGNLYIAGTTIGGIKMGRENGELAHSQVPYTHKNQYTGFICKIDHQVQQIVAATYLGGSTEAYRDPTPNKNINPTSVVFTNKQIINHMVLANNEYLYVTGKTGSVDFPETSDSYQPYFSGGTDAFICGFETEELSLTYATFFGGSGPDFGKQIAASDDGMVYLIGQTYSTNFENLTENYNIGGTGFEFVLELNQVSEVVSLENNLKIALNKILNRSENQDITQNDLRHLPQAIDLSHSMMTDLTGLEQAKYIKELNLSYNNISDIIPISRLPYLQYLDISDNRVSNVSTLKLLPHLETYFANNQIVTTQETFTSIGNEKILYIPFITLNLEPENTKIMISNISDQGIYHEENQTISWLNLSAGDQVSYDFNDQNGFSGTVYVEVMGITPVESIKRYRYFTPSICSKASAHSLIYGVHNRSKEAQVVRVKIYDVNKKVVVHKEVLHVGAGKKVNYVFGKIPPRYKVVFQVYHKKVYVFSVPRLQGKRVPIKRSYVIIAKFYDNHNMKCVKMK